MTNEKQDNLPVASNNVPAVAIFGSLDPDALIRKASDYATALAKVIEDKKLYAVIKEKKHTQVEGWTTLGAMLGVFPHVIWSKRLPEKDADIGFEARVSIQTLDGKEIASAEMQCSTKEKNWHGRDEYAVRSMAQTRATSKAFRLGLSWIMVLAGYEATPLEEIIGSSEFANKDKKSGKSGKGQQNKTFKSGPEVEKIKKLLEEREVPDTIRKQIMDQLSKLTKNQAQGWIKNLEKRPKKKRTPLPTVDSTAGEKQPENNEESPQDEDSQLRDVFIAKYIETWLKSKGVDPKTNDKNLTAVARNMGEKKVRKMTTEQVKVALAEMEEEQ